MNEATESIVGDVNDIVGACAEGIKRVASGYGRWWTSDIACSGRGRIIVGRRSRMVKDDMVNIICCPVNRGYVEKIWSWVELVKPSMSKLGNQQVDTCPDQR